jgi:hypothetical protein
MSFPAFITSSTPATGNSNNTSSTNSQYDWNIYPVGTSIDASSCVYDNQTIVMVNSSVSQSVNTIKAQYFDPLEQGNWNFSMTSNSILAGTFASSELLSESTSSFMNLQATAPSATGKYTLDITNGTSDGSGTSTEFFSLTSQPYACFAGTYASTPTYNNVNPNYTNTGTDSFIFTSNYYVQQKNEILIIQLIFTIQNVGSLNVNSTSTNVPVLYVTVVNKVITQDAQASLSSGFDNVSKPKIYRSTPYPLQFMAINGQPVSNFDPTQSYNYVFNYLPIVFAPNFVKLSANLSLIYIPPIQVGDVWNGQYLSAGGNGFAITSGNPTFYPTTGLTQLNPVRPVQFGHFVVGVSYNQDGYSSSYVPYANIYAEYMIRNIWRSPLAIYNSYSGVSVSELAQKQVLLLFGSSTNGGTFLVMNTGTPINIVTGFAVTSLNNFMMIMRALKTNNEGQTAYMSYLTDPNIINTVNATGYFSIMPVTINKVTDGTIINPTTVKASPNMSYMLLNNKNSANMIVDIAEQFVVNKDLGISYLGMSSSVIMATGNNKYNMSNVKIENMPNLEVFGNSIYLGTMTGKSGTTTSLFYVIVILPEASFNPSGVAGSTNQMAVFADEHSPFYVQVSGNNGAGSIGGYTQFAPRSNINGNRLLMSVSNTPPIFGNPV